MTFSTLCLKGPLAPARQPTNQAITPYHQPVYCQQKRILVKWCSKKIHKHTYTRNIPYECECLSKHCIQAEVAMVIVIRRRYFHNKLMSTRKVKEKKSSRKRRRERKRDPFKVWSALVEF